MLSSKLNKEVYSYLHYFGFVVLALKYFQGSPAKSVCGSNSQSHFVCTNRVQYCNGKGCCLCCRTWYEIVLCLSLFSFISFYISTKPNRPEIKTSLLKYALQLPNATKLVHKKKRCALLFTLNLSPFFSRMYFQRHVVKQSSFLFYYINFYNSLIKLENAHSNARQFVPVVDNILYSHARKNDVLLFFKCSDHNILLSTIHASKSYSCRCCPSDFQH